jgi:hypothetical protein
LYFAPNPFPEKPLILPCLIDSKDVSGCFCWSYLLKIKVLPAFWPGLRCANSNGPAVRPGLVFGSDSIIADSGDSKCTSALAVCYLE